MFVVVVVVVVVVFVVVVDVVVVGGGVVGVVVDCFVDALKLLQAAGALAAVGRWSQAFDLTDTWMSF